MITFTPSAPTPSPLKAYGIRFHGRSWLKIATPHDPMVPQIGWRPFFWTNRLDEAEKFGSEMQAAAFGEMICSGPFEVAEITPKTAGVDQIA